MKKLSRHLPHYFSLFGILGFGLLAFFIFSYDKPFQVIVAASTAIGYACWGLIHHSIHKDLDLSVLIEYISFAILGFVILVSLILRS